jgi:hypothetical protein
MDGFFHKPPGRRILPATDETGIEYFSVDRFSDFAIFYFVLDSAIMFYHAIYTGKK